MRKGTKIWLIVAAALVAAGCIVFGAVMTILKWDFTKLSTVTYETNIHEINEPVSSISINADTADIQFFVSTDGKCRVECYEKQNATHSVAVLNGTLEIQLNDNRSVYDLVEINFHSPKIKVYLPDTAYVSLFIKESTGDIEIPKDFTFQNVKIALSTGDIVYSASASQSIKIKTTTGDIRVANVSTGTLDLSISTGKVHLTDIVCKNLISTGNTGDITLKNVVADETFSIRRTTGDVKFDGCDAFEITVETSTGNVTGSLLTGKVFIANASTGSVKVPDTTSGGRCKITTTTGNIKIVVQS